MTERTFRTDPKDGRQQVEQMMNENTIQVVEAPATKSVKAKKAPVKAAKPAPANNGGFSPKVYEAWHGRTCNCTQDGRLTKRQVDVLKVMAKRKGPATIEQLATAIKTDHAKTVRWAIGNINEEGRDPYSLLERGLVKQVKILVDGKAEYEYQITASGAKAALKADK